MKVTRWMRCTAAALACAAFTPQFGVATARDPGWDWCAKTGDYYDAGGNGYHVITCYHSYYGYGWYYIAHGTEFTITMM